MREINLLNALEAIESSRPATRKQGLENLESVLRQNRNSSNVQGLSANDFHQVIETLLEIAVEEKDNLFKAKTTSQAKSKVSAPSKAAASRLTACTSAIRLTIEIGVASLRKKTVSTIFQHLIQEAWADTGSNKNELTGDYFKALSTILDHRPHLEHITEKHWAQLVDLCCTALKDIHENASPFPEGPIPLPGRSTVRSERSSRANTPGIAPEASSTRARAADRPAPSSPRRTDDVASCLEKLMSANHLAILEKASAVLDIVGNVLNATVTINRVGTQQPCLSILNSVLAEAMTEDIELAHKVLKKSIYFSRRHWGSHKVGQSLKDQMLITLIQGQLLIPSLLEQEGIETDISDLDGLLDRLMTEYRGRLIKDMLSLHEVDLNFNPPDLDLGLLALRGISVRSNELAESSWFQLSIIADLFIRLRMDLHHAATANVNAPGSKRRRMETPFQSLASVVSVGKQEEIVASLQFLTFILGSTEITAEQLQFTLEKLFPLLSQDNGEISNWSLLALTMAAHQISACQAATNEVTWHQIFQVAVTRFSTSRVSRLSCYLAHTIISKDLVSFVEASDMFESLLAAVDVSGPSFLDDASVAFWTSLLASYNAHRAASYEHAVKSILRWLFTTWKPSRSGLTRAKPQALKCITELFAVLLDGKPNIFKQRRRVLHILSRACLQHEKESTLIKYLLSVEERSLSPLAADKEGAGNAHQTRLSSKSKRLTLGMICDYLLTEMASLSSAFNEASQSSQLSLALIRSSLSICVVALGIHEDLTAFDTSKANALLSQAIKLRDATADAFKSIDLSQDRVAHMIQTVYSVFDDLPLLPLRSFKSLTSTQLGVIRASKAFGKQFWRNISELQCATSDLNNDPMDIEESQESHVSRSSTSQPTQNISHDWLSAYTDQAAYQACVRADLCLACEIPDQTASSADLDDVLPSEIVDYLTSLSPSEFLAARPFLDDVYRSKLHIRGPDGIKILEHIAKALQGYDLERCETAIGTCVDLMAHLVRQWAPPEMDDVLADVASQLYQYFLVFIDRRVATPHACTTIANMLQKVIKVNPDYSRSLDGPSSRTVLFKILAEGSAKVKFDISKSISAVFGLFILREHDNILDDIEASIPHDPDCLPVTAVRLFLLSRLAASWPTLIRRCVYAIVDATGLTPDLGKYAHSCLQFLGKELGIESQHELFKLFVSQILYTWLGNRPLSDLPYAIFDYDSLDEMISDCKHEIAAQIVMHGKENEVEQIAKVTKIQFSELVTEAFGKCAAYCIARDTAVAPDENKEAAHAAVRLRKYVGREEYKTLISQRFPDIVATFFKITDREDQITKGFQKHERHAAAQEAYESMLQSGVSQNTPPVSQQPSFSSTCLINELEYVCERSAYSLDDLWTPALYVYVFRGLLETIQAALGPLHAAAVVRRIRILVSMGGKIGTSGYCLEVALGSLRPYLDNTHSAEDVMGLYRYLLTVGRDYLQHNLPFLTGFVVSVLASLKAFMDRPQESTTQESVFRSTLTKAQEFHEWITEYALGIQVSSKDYNAETLRLMVKCAAKLQGHGTSDQGTPEGQLLLYLLEDKARGESLIDELSRKRILRILSKQFAYTELRSNDILVCKETIGSLAHAAWQYFDPGGASRSFNLWLLRGLGGTYACTGSIEQSFCNEVADRTETNDLVSSQEHPTLTSSVALIKILYRVVSNNSTSEAGIAERTIQSLLTQADKDNTLKSLESAVPKQALTAMTWANFYPPLITTPEYKSTKLQDAFIPKSCISVPAWATNICIALIGELGHDNFLDTLKAVLVTIPAVSEAVLPYVLHLVLAKEAGKSEQIRKIVSSQIKQVLLKWTPQLEPHVKQIINAIIYLRSQPLPQEKTRMEGTKWLEIDYRQLASVAVECRMYKSALLFIETAMSSETQTRSSRRSSAAANNETPTDLLLTIFQNVDERDYYYGVRQSSSLGSMMEKLEFEGASFESLAFRGMAYDSEARQGSISSRSPDAFIKNLNDVQLSSLSHAVAATVEASAHVSREPVFDAARKLEKWDMPVPETDAGPAVNLYQAFQMIQTASSVKQVLSIVDSRLEVAYPLVAGVVPNKVASSNFWSSLASLVEIESILTCTSSDQLQQTCLELEQQGKWMESTSFESIEQILSCRQTLFSILSKSPSLQAISNSSPKLVRLAQVQSLLSSSKMSRIHGNLASSLSAATAIEQLLPTCQQLGLETEAAARLEASNVLWEQGQMTPSIEMLQDILNNVDLKRQDIAVGRADILSKLASRISEARLEQPDRIFASYLDPALKEIRNEAGGEAAGQVFHEFASFCDRQLQDQDSLEDFNRVRKMRDDKASEVQQLDEMIRQARPSKERDTIKSHRNKAKTWLDLDEAEYRRIKASRDLLLTQSLDMYLLCLQACDSYDRDAMRFSALWLQNADDKSANIAVKRHIKDVSSSKFASLMNQWTSRLLDETNEFQKLLSGLVVRICGDHPYHGIYNIFVSSKSRGGKDAVALSRHAAANQVVELLKQQRENASKWITLHNACVNYQRFAAEKKANLEKWKQGEKCQLRKLPSGLKLEQDVVNLRVPPPTMEIPLRKDRNYKDVPVIVGWSSEFSVASGLSAPKIVTARASNGEKYKMLFKSGNDDLRQDAIMEQVFEQVSDLLRAHRETRQRKLGIRSYKVLPLTHSAGVIEFVSNTIPLLEYLTPAHQEHFPNDLRNSGARKIIQDAASAGSGNEHRIREYKKVCERFHPVLRFFFMERFVSPDEWFDRRLAYTRTTAAISMLGHVLGLGDRHGHNILLDEKTGEVIHIDLGIAFEQGRVLPIPETVPFRLTRDIVDGMGITKTEGVFRRCCEFTLDALRKESYGILTILDVLRFDPLYSWSISPLRLRRLQADRSQAEEETAAEDGEGGQGKVEREKNEEAEADRALTVVSKKLSKSLSVEATVNQLIQQATDERNLALLFAGWAAYF